MVRMVWGGGEAGTISSTVQVSEMQRMVNSKGDRGETGVGEGAGRGRKKGGERRE